MFEQYFSSSVLAPLFESLYITAAILSVYVSKSIFCEASIDISNVYTLSSSEICCAYNTISLICEAVMTDHNGESFTFKTKYLATDSLIAAAFSSLNALDSINEFSICAVQVSSTNNCKDFKFNKASFIAK